MATRMEQVDDFKARAEGSTAGTGHAATVYATLALTTAVVRVGDLLAEHNTQLTELVRLAREGREAWDATQPTRPCYQRSNDAADFAEYCSKPTGHYGPHSYEEDEDAQSQS